MPGFLLCAKSNWTVYRELSDSVQTVNCHPKSRSFMVTILKINSNTEQKLNASQNAVRRLAPITRIAQSLSEPLTLQSCLCYCPPPLCQGRGRVWFPFSCSTNKMCIMKKMACLESVFMLILLLCHSTFTQNNIKMVL